jgi:uncharacterized protein (TIRG00374 family)
LTHNQTQEFSHEHHEVLHSIRSSRIVIPIILGLLAVGYLFWKNFDFHEFAQIQWTQHTYIWILVAVGLSVLWHLSYAYRLWVLTEGDFSWWKCIELIFIWEFSSAVSPTSLGGSAVALFVLAQEKLSAARTVTIVLYTVVLDSFFLLLTLPFLFMIFGPSIMRPGVETFSDTGIWGIYFMATYSIMAAYSLFIYYGIFINPSKIKGILGWLTNNRLLQRFHQKALVFGEDMAVASVELKKQSLSLHLKAIAGTTAAWTLRFLIISALIIAFLPDLPLDFMTQFELYSRLEMMFFVIAFSPTPGGAGLIEILFGGFLTDYVTNATQATMISMIWRALSYYIYLFAGVFIVPNWIRQRINERRMAKLEAALEQD